MRKNNHNKNQKAGFTLIEIIVAVGIFSIVMVMAISAVLSIVSANKKAQSLSSVINNLNFVFESMVRDLRTGTEYSSCGLSGSGIDNVITDCIGFKSSQEDGSRVEYELSGKSITKRVDGDPIALTADEVAIDHLLFTISDVGKPFESNFVQPTILITLKGYAGNASKDISETVTVKDDSRFNLQTLVVQRKLDID